MVARPRCCVTKMIPFRVNGNLYKTVVLIYVYNYVSTLVWLNTRFELIWNEYMRGSVEVTSTDDKYVQIG